MKILLSLAAVAFVAAATPAQVAPLVAQQGYFIEQGADATVAVVADAVAEARFDGGALSVVVLADEPPSGATTFADAVLDGLPSRTGTVLVVGPETVGWASSGDKWTDGQLDAALDASLGGATSDDVVTLFVDALLSPPGSGVSGALVFFGIVLAAGGAFGLFTFRASRQQRTRAAEQVEKLRATAQLQIDAIANDILDLEDEVKLSGNDQVQELFSTAVGTYSTASDRLAAMTSGRAIVDLDAELDIAVWRLDSVEAILDGKPLPEKPKPLGYSPAPKARPATQAKPTPDVIGSRPEYKRRSQRRSSYGAGDMLEIFLATQAIRTIGLGGRGYSRSGGRSRPRIPRMRGGGRRR